MMFSMNIGLGVVGANLVNYLAQRIHPWGWRLSLAAAAVPGVAVLFAGLFLEDTPSFLISGGEQEKGKEVLMRILGCKDVSREYMELVDASRVKDEQQLAGTQSKSLGKMVWRRKHAPQLLVAIAMPFFQQFSGNDAILFYGPFLFKAAGLGAQASLYSTLVIGIVSFVGIMVSILIVDRFGRRKILLTSTIVMFVCMVKNLNIHPFSSCNYFLLDSIYNSIISIIVCVCICICICICICDVCVRAGHDWHRIWVGH